MFHTYFPFLSFEDAKCTFVVIPWRGFRCFTHAKYTFPDEVAYMVVVIPWRGFRCFTRDDRGLDYGVVSVFRL